MKEIIFKQIKSAESICMLGHIRPDGDCLGSIVGLSNYIKDVFNKQVDVYLEEIPNGFKCLKGIEGIKTNFEEDKSYDLCIVLDSSSIDRLGDFQPYFENSNYTICIDHHISNTKYAKFNLVVSQASSTCEVVYGLLDYEKISKTVAEAIYIGIVHDTGCFKYSNTSSDTLRIAAKLVEKDIDFSTLINETMYQKTYIQNQILGRCLLESFTMFDKKCLVSVVSKSTLEFYGATMGDLEGIVNQLIDTQGIEIAIFMKEQELLEYKVSLRSKNKIDVSKIATYFGGGGHIRAAGCTMKGSSYDVINNLAMHIEKQLESESD